LLFRSSPRRAKASLFCPTRAAHAIQRNTHAARAIVAGPFSFAENAMRHVTTHRVLFTATLLLAGCAADATTNTEPSDETGNALSASPSGVDPGHVIDGQLRRFIRLPMDASARARATAQTSPILALAAAPQGSPVAASVRGSMTPVRDQGSRGTCVEFASTALVEHRTRGDVSEQAMVKFFGGNDGAAFSYRLGDFLSKGYVDERLAEYDLNDMNVHVPSDKTYAQLVARSSIAPSTPLQETIASPSQAAAISAIKTAILAGKPIGVGFFVPDGTMNTGSLSTPSSPTCHGVPITSANLGDCDGHAVAITGFNDGTMLLEFKNSWGTGWGDHGYGTMTYDFFVRYQAGPIMTVNVETNQPNEAAIANVYLSTLGREPMSWELDAWVNNLSHGWTLATMRAAFAKDAQADDAIRAVYEETLGRTPAAWELGVWQNNIRSGAWSIPQMKSAFAADGQNRTAIIQVYQDCFARTPAEWEISVWRSNIGGGAWTIPMMRNAFALDGQTRTAINNAYLQKLGRAATTAEIDQQQLAIHDNGLTIAQLIANL
jgi:C1A family cysteine protease